MTVDNPAALPPAPFHRQPADPRGPFTAPLSDLAVSPFAMPTSLLRGEVRVAWVGRTSTEEQQDPRQSLIRQLRNSKQALPESWAIVCHFYDVESGRMELTDRGRKSGYERFDIPIARDGGITDLLIEATHPSRRFDVVICEGVSRTARRMFEGLSIERELERAGVPLFASNEPIRLDGSRAQQILQRRINQSVAEYEVLNTLELSWGGLCTHVREGWNIGKPPHGYKAKHYRHPNPVKAERGATKTRLEPDGALGETVTQIAGWRYFDGLGYDSIVNRLNADSDLYPVPVPPGGPARARGAWSKSTVCDILRNPKYTGYQVFNRRGTRSRHGAYNDPALWVWSPELTHEPLIPKWMYDELQERRRDKSGSRAGADPNSHPATRRTYVLRSRVICFCRRRMSGKVRKRSTYYACWPKGNNYGRPQAYAGHPTMVYINENVLLDAVSTFFADRVFGPDRRELFAEGLASVDNRAAHERDIQRDRLRRSLADVKRRQSNILRQAQEAAPDDPFASGLRTAYNELEERSRSALSALDVLEAADAAEPARPSADTADLLDALPYLVLNLPRVPEPLLHRLFEITQLTIQLHADSDDLTLTIKLPEDYIPDVAHTAERITSAMPQHTRSDARSGKFAHPVGASQGALFLRGGPAAWTRRASLSSKRPAGVSRTGSRSNSRVTPSS